MCVLSCDPFVVQRCQQVFCDNLKAISATAVSDWPADTGWPLNNNLFKITTNRGQLLSVFGFKYKI